MAVQAALRNHAAHILRWLNYIPQTNEIGRSAVLIATALILERRFNLPLIVSELGASAGLNLLFDPFALSSHGFTYQPHKATLTLTPDWRGAAPPPGRFQIAGCAGVDLSPINPRSSEGFLRLCAYTWPDQTERLQQLAGICPAQRVAIAQGDAANWLRLRLAAGYPGSPFALQHNRGALFFPPNATKLQASARNIGTAGKSRHPSGRFCNGS